MSTIYYFDIGNTRGKFWRCSDGRVQHFVALPHEGAPGRLMAELPQAFDELPAAVHGASVMGPVADAALALAMQQKWGVPPAFAASTAAFGRLRNAYGEPGRLGIDRWLGLIAAAEWTEEALVVGCGTAITLDVLRGGSHGGGYILPGLGLWASMVQEGLRGVQFSVPATAGTQPGRSTAEAVCNGALLSVVAAIERVMATQGVPQLILTGGDADRLAPHLRAGYRLEPDLLLHGLQRYFGDPVIKGRASRPA